jgi:hypothetical protein
MRARLGTAFAAVAAVVGLLVGLTSLVDWLGRQFDDPKPPPPSEIDARVGDVSLRSSAEPLETYLRSIGESLRGLTRAELREEGFVFAVRVRLTGAVGEKFPLTWSLHEAGTGSRLRGWAYNQPAQVTFVPRGREHARTWPIWVPSPGRRGSYFLRATLKDEKGLPVDERDSPDFEVTRIQRQG